MIDFPGMVLTKERANEFFEKEMWTEESFVDVLQWNAEHYPTLVHKDEKRQLTYRELWEEVEALAASLYEHGIRKGDKVAIQLPNSLDYVVAVFGAARLGAAAVLLQVDMGRQGLSYCLDKSEAKAWIVAESYRGDPLIGTAETLQATLPDLTNIIVREETEGGAQGHLRLHDLYQSSKRLDEKQLKENHPEPLSPFVMVFTSGTTGSPKGVVQLHANYLWASRAYARVFEFQPEQATFDVAPICHQTGMLAGVMMPIATAGRIHLMDRFSAKRVLRWIEKEQPTYIIGAPPHVIHVAHAEHLKETKTDSVRLFIYAGAPVPSAVLRQLQEDSGMTVAAMFGWTEGFLATATHPDDPIEAVSSTVGFAIPGTEVLLVDEEGNQVSAGTPGEMLCRGPNFSAGYYKNAEAAKRQWDKDGWFHSGDLLRQDENGRYIFMGRADDIINRGGTKIDPKAVEDACAAHPAIANVAVVGQADDTLGQRTVACIVVKEGETTPALSELRDFLGEQGLAKFQFPDRLEVVSSLPLTHSGKIKKKELRSRLQEFVVKG
ncbi:class I adenylate-forming enzyme family protein [Alicyclobacillus sp. SO9]|uniref:class I adenylate-forming enzyme family protein n=1 Tax=Alicyclobacillus sp. SO9 TaxID=2665646 RepID=UPI0018E73E70|nr:class I adenylate-forming enzyme family protein [Alicyclobacillus sp. SO9]QQE76853.1 acyl--CoA ligase [Alicyclobacillus sp. SO9]